MKKIDPAHPSALIDPDVVRTLRQYAADAEKLRQLHPEQLQIIYHEKWFNLFVPEDCGGLELSLPEALRMEEALAWTDGSLGWTVTLCSGANWFIGFLPVATADMLFHQKQVCLAGSGRPSGIAVITPHGYTITGRWKYATGAPHATVFTASCLLYKDGQPLMDDKGKPLTDAFWFYRQEVTIHDDWNSMGMIATASQSFEVKDINVPVNRRFSIDSTKTVLQNPVFQYPFLQFAEATLAVNSCGMAIWFYELCEALVTEKEKNNEPGNAAAISFFREKITTSKKKLLTTRKAFYTAVDFSWKELEKNQQINQAALQAVSDSSRQLAAGSLHLADTLYPYAGITAATPTTGINRVWRDVHTASQHTLLTYPFTG